MTEPTNPPAGQRLDRADASLNQGFSRQDAVNDPAATCPLRNQAPQKRYYNVGLRMRIQQYNIIGRKMSLNVPIRSLGSLAVPDDFHQLKGSSLAPSVQCDEPRKPTMLYALGSDGQAPDFFEGDLICATELVAEAGLEGYQKGGKQGDLNAFLGSDLGMHIFRTNTFRVKTTGDYEHDQLVRIGPLAPTEMMCCKLFTYLKAKIDGNDTYYEIKDGAIAGTLSYADYLKRARIEANVYTDPEGGAMPFIPGVYQLHVLIESSAEGAFTLKEIYCDGDCIYPE